MNSCCTFTETAAFECSFIFGHVSIFVSRYPLQVQANHF